MLSFRAPMFARPAGAGGSPGAANFTVPSGALSADVTAFPVWVDLADLDSDFWSAVASDGSTIKVSQGGTELPLDVVAIDTGSESGHLFFKADLLAASDNDFLIEPAGRGSAAAVTDPTGRNAVWSAFHRVFDGQANVDRTGSGSTFSLVGNASFSGGKINFDGNDDFAYCPVSGFDASTKISLFVVGYLASGGGATHKGIASLANAGTGTPGYRNSLLIRSTNNWSLWDNGNSWLESGRAASFNANFTAAEVYDTGGNRYLWKDGASIASASVGALTLSAVTHLTLGGEDDTPAQESNEQLDLVLLAKSKLSDAFMEALHDNRRNSGSFYSVT